MTTETPRQDAGREEAETTPAEEHRDVMAADVAADRQVEKSKRAKQDGSKKTTGANRDGSKKDAKKAAKEDAKEEDGSKTTSRKDAKKRDRAAKRDGKAAERAERAARERRYAVVYDVERPHIRLGLIWFVLAVTALVVGPWGLAVVYGLPAAIGALQIAKSWRRRGRGPFLPVAGLGALAMALVSPFGGRAVGIVVLVAVAASVIAGGLEPGRPGSTIDAAALTVRSWLFVGLAAVSVVLVHAYQPSAAIALVILVSAYEAGDYVIGSGSPNAVEGPVAGIAAVAVFTFSLFVVEPSPFEAQGVLLYGAVVAVLAPVGQLFASALLPTSGAVASGLRRLDSLLLAGPVWVVLLQSGVGQ